MLVILQLFIIGANQDLYFEEGQESIIHIQEEIVCFRFRLNNLYMRRRRFCVLIRQNVCQPMSHLLYIFPVKQSNESPLLVEIIFFCILTYFLVTNRKNLKKGKKSMKNTPERVLCILTSFRVLRAPESWLKYCFSAIFNFFVFSLDVTIG